MAGTTTISVTRSRPPAAESRAPTLAEGSDPEIEIPRARPAAPPRAGGVIEERTTLAPGQRAGRWKIERELGRGGMAAVYAVVHAWVGKRAALKLAHSAVFRAPLSAATFLREAAIVNRIDHPGVIDVFATGTHDGRPYLVMEQLAGQTLGERLDAGPVPRGEAVDLLLELCDVLRAAHAAGVVHRDLKLDNVYLLAHPRGGGRRLKLLDWGMATITGEPDPLAGMIAGTLTYVAPEQVRGEAVTPASDVYALGVLAYQMLLGTPPFASPSDLELLQMHLRTDPPAPSSLWPEIPPALDALLTGMLAKLPAARPPLAEVAQVLRDARRTLRPAPTRRPAASSWLGVPVVPVGSRAPAIHITAHITAHVTSHTTAQLVARAASTASQAVLGARHRQLGALLALAVAAASLGSLFG